MSNPLSLSNIKNFLKVNSNGELVINITGTIGYDSFIFSNEEMFNFLSFSLLDPNGNPITLGSTPKTSFNNDGYVEGREYNFFFNYEVVVAPNVISDTSNLTLKADLTPEAHQKDVSIKGGLSTISFDINVDNDIDDNNVFSIYHKEENTGDTKSLYLYIPNKYNIDTLTDLDQNDNYRVTINSNNRMAKIEIINNDDFDLSESLFKSDNIKLSVYNNITNRTEEKTVKINNYKVNINENISYRVDESLKFTGEENTQYIYAGVNLNDPSHKNISSKFSLSFDVIENETQEQFQTRIQNKLYKWILSSSSNSINNVYSNIELDVNSLDGFANRDNLNFYEVDLNAKFKLKQPINEDYSHFPAYNSREFIKLSVFEDGNSLFDLDLQLSDVRLTDTVQDSINIQKNSTLKNIQFNNLSLTDLSNKKYGGSDSSSNKFQTIEFDGTLPNYINNQVITYDALNQKFNVSFNLLKNDYLYQFDNKESAYLDFDMKLKITLQNGNTVNETVRVGVKVNDLVNENVVEITSSDNSTVEFTLNLDNNETNIEKDIKGVTDLEVMYQDDGITKFFDTHEDLKTASTSQQDLSSYGDLKSFINTQKTSFSIISDNGRHSFLEDQNSTNDDFFEISLLNTRLNIESNNNTAIQNAYLEGMEEVENLVLRDQYSINLTDNFTREVNKLLTDKNNSLLKDVATISLDSTGKYIVSLSVQFNSYDNNDRTNKVNVKVDVSDIVTNQFNVDNVLSQSISLDVDELSNSDNIIIDIANNQPILDKLMNQISIPNNNSLVKYKVVLFDVNNIILNDFNTDMTKADFENIIFKDNEKLYKLKYAVQAYYETVDANGRPTLHNLKLSPIQDLNVEISNDDNIATQQIQKHQVEFNDNNTTLQAFFEYDKYLSANLDGKFNGKINVVDSVNQSSKVSLGVMLDLSLFRHYLSNKNNDDVVNKQIKLVTEILNKYESLGIEKNNIDLKIFGYANKAIDFSTLYNNSSDISDFSNKLTTELNKILNLAQNAPGANPISYNFNNQTLLSSDLVFSRASVAFDTVKGIIDDITQNSSNSLTKELVLFSDDYLYNSAANDIGDYLETINKLNLNNSIIDNAKANGININAVNIYEGVDTSTESITSSLLRKFDTDNNDSDAIDIIFGDNEITSISNKIVHNVTPLVGSEFNVSSMTITLSKSIKDYNKGSGDLVKIEVNSISSNGDFEIDINAINAARLNNNGVYIDNNNNKITITDISNFDPFLFNDYDELKTTVTVNYEDSKNPGIKTTAFEVDAKDIFVGIEHKDVSVTNVNNLTYQTSYNNSDFVQVHVEDALFGDRDIDIKLSDSSNQMSINYVDVKFINSLGLEESIRVTRDTSLTDNDSIDLSKVLTDYVYSNISSSSLINNYYNYDLDINISNNYNNTTNTYSIDNVLLQNVDYAGLSSSLLDSDI